MFLFDGLRPSYVLAKKWVEEDFIIRHGDANKSRKGDANKSRKGDANKSRKYELAAKWMELIL